MKKIIDYTIVGGNLDRVISTVKELIGKGWQPLGGISFHSAGYDQALVKYETLTSEQVIEQDNRTDTDKILDDFHDNPESYDTVEVGDGFNGLRIQVKDKWFRLVKKTKPDQWERPGEV